MESFRNFMEITRREFKSYFESPVAYVFLIVFLILNGFMTFMVGQYYESMLADLRLFFQWHPWVYLLLVPAVSMRLWAEEQKSGTIELLLTLPITPAQAIMGKFIAAWSFIAIALFLTFPVIITTYYLGSPDSGVIIGGYLGSLLLAGTYVSVGLFASALTKNQVISFVIALMMCLLLLLAGFPPVTAMFTKWAPDWLVQTVASFSFIPHFDSIQRGVIDIRDLAYYASVIVVMLFSTQLVIETKKST
ncbi:MAG: ABC transporter permease subunit [Lentisphaerae bacterium]|jgi:ABC-2 type transport system permease protein|nr:ABC transporter permease subunit [Lentisphaerota bacterium]